MPDSTVPASTTQPAKVRVNAITHSYTALAGQVRDEGLTGRAHGFYALLFGGLLLAFGGVVTGVLLLGESWLQLLMAAALGILFTQFAFLGHEASHRQILSSGKANDRLGRVLATFFVGISYAWWMNKHSRHHANPNKIGKDPDVEMDTVSFLEESAASRRGLMAWFTRRQGFFFFPLLLLEGVNLHGRSFADLVTRPGIKNRGLELALIGGRFTLYLTALFWLLPVGMAFAFLGVQLAVFGFYMGAAFAPNHTGMPIIPRDVTMDFLSKQVRTSRNISGGWWATWLMGGLNYQIEHHLFPSMPRMHLARTRVLVREHCRTQDVPYTETSLPRAYVHVVGYLNRVGLAARDPFTCPLAGSLRGL